MCPANGGVARNVNALDQSLLIRLHVNDSLRGDLSMPGSYCYLEPLLVIVKRTSMERQCGGN